MTDDEYSEVVEFLGKLRNKTAAAVTALGAVHSTVCHFHDKMKEREGQLRFDYQAQNPHIQ